MYRGPIEFETDSKCLAHELRDGAPNRSHIYGIIQDIKYTLSGFAEYKVSSVARESNILAHELAAEARSKGDLHIIGNVPDRLRELMLSESSPPLE